MGTNTRQLDMMLPEPIAVHLRGRDVMFDPIRLSDISAFITKIHNERRVAVEANLERLGGTPAERARLLWAVNQGNVDDDVYDQLKFPENIIWLVERCFKRANPDVEWALADAITLPEMKEVFAAIGAASGVLVRPTDAGEDTTKTETPQTGETSSPTSPTSTPASGELVT